MYSPTEIIQGRVAAYFDCVDRKIEHVLDFGSSSELSGFLQTYIREYPTLGDYIYEALFSRTPSLNGTYTDHTLSRLRSGEETGFSPRERAKYYNDKIIKPLLAKKQLTVRDCPVPAMEKFRSHWRGHLQEKGCSFIGRADGIANVRNTVFHLAFALDLEPESVSKVLTKCLLMQDFNPKDPVEVIYYWCLKYQIPYPQMLREYLDYYNSQAIDTDFRGSGAAPIPEGNTFYIMENLESISRMEKPALMEYLWRLKISSPSRQSRKTPRQIYRECFDLFPEFLYTAPGQNAPKLSSLLSALDYLVASEEFTRQKALKDGNELPADTRKKNFRGEKVLSEKERRPLLVKILEINRRNYYRANTLPLLPGEILQFLFEGIAYSEAIVRKRIYGEIPLTRKELLATMFLYYLADTVNQESEIGSKAKSLDLFEEEASDNLFQCGMHTFYLRNPFDLFLALCFLQDDPLAYFMASWEAARLAANAQ